MVLQCAWRSCNPLIPTTAMHKRIALHHICIAMYHSCIRRCVYWRYRTTRRFFQVDSELFERRQPGHSFDNCPKDYAVRGDASEFLLEEGHATQEPTAVEVFQSGERSAICYKECSEEWTTKLAQTVKRNILERRYTYNRQ